MIQHMMIELSAIIEFMDGKTFVVKVHSRYDLHAITTLART